MKSERMLEIERLIFEIDRIRLSINHLQSDSTVKEFIKYIDKLRENYMIEYDSLR